MIGVIKYIWYTSKKVIITKSILQIIVIVLGILLNCLLYKTNNEDISQVNIIFYIIILFFCFDTYMQSYKNMRRMKFDKYIAATEVGLKKFNDGIVIFDFLFLLYSYFNGCIYVIIIYSFYGGNLKYELMIISYTLLIFMIVKLVCIIITIILRDTKSTILFSLLLNVFITKIFTDDIEYYMEWMKRYIYFVVLGFIILLVLGRGILTKLWKEDF